MSIEPSAKASLLTKIQPYVTSGQVFFTQEEEYLAKITASFPFQGSAIDWPDVHDSFEDIADQNDYLRSTKSFFELVALQAGLKYDDRLVVIGDSALDTAINMPVMVFRECFDEILSLHQHTYLVDPDVQWCACFRMEGDMGFGFAYGGT